MASLSDRLTTSPCIAKVVRSELLPRSREGGVPSVLVDELAVELVFEFRQVGRERRSRYEEPFCGQGIVEFLGKHQVFPQLAQIHRSPFLPVPRPLPHGSSHGRAPVRRLPSMVRSVETALRRKMRQHCRKF